MSKTELVKKIAYEYEDDDVSEYSATFKFDISSRLLELIFHTTRNGLIKKGLKLPTDPEKEGYTDINILSNYYGVILTSLYKSIHELEKETGRKFYTSHVESAKFYMEGKKWHIKAIIKGSFLINANK